MDTLTLKLRGMSCASSATRNEEAIQSVPGEREPSVKNVAEHATVNYDKQKKDLKTILEA